MYRPLSAEVSNQYHIMSGGEAIAAALIENGVDTIFGLPGAQMYPLFDALYTRRDRIRTVGARHEQGCGYGAFGYAQSTGKPGVFSVVPGIGVLNAASAMATGWGCNVPMLCVTGEIPAAFIGRRRGHLHELPDQLGTLRKIVKWAERIERPADAPEIINQAFRHMLSGRPGPVAVEMAWDVMASREPVRMAGAAVIAPPVLPDPATVDAAAKMLLAARRPMIFAGSGARDASPEVLALAEYLNAPVASLRGGRGVVSEDHRLGVTSYAAKLLWEDTDLCLGIGSRLEMPYLRWAGQFLEMVDAPVGPPHLIRIDIDPGEMHRLRPKVGIVGDAAEATRQLLEAVRKLDRPPSVRTLQPEEAKARSDAAIEHRLAPYPQYLAAIRAALPDNGIIVDEVSQAGFASQVAYKVVRPRTYITAGFQGSLGFGFPTALGVKVANPQAVVVSITGDGGFMFASQELATVAQENIALITIIFNNNAFGNVKRDQERMYGGRLMCADLVNPDFVALAHACNITGRTVSSPEELAIALNELIQMNLPAVIEIKITEESEGSPWEFLL